MQLAYIVTNGTISSCRQVSTEVPEGMLGSVNLKFLIRDLEMNANEISHDIRFVTIVSTSRHMEIDGPAYNYTIYLKKTSDQMLCSP